LHFDEVVKGFVFIKNIEESCVYKKISGNVVVFLVLYVDDILLIRNDIPMMEAVKFSLRKSFSMKHLGEAAYILGIKIYRDRSKRHCWGYFFYMYHQLVLSGIPTRSLDLRSILFLTRCSCALLDCQTLLGN
jgi:hypothetical protein